MPRQVLRAVWEPIASIMRRPRGRALLSLALLAPIAIVLVALLALSSAAEAPERIPVALVNLDEGAADASGRGVFAGSELVDDLLDAGELAWVEVDRATAEEGLRTGAFSLALVIPESYSASVASLSSDDPERAVLEVISTESGNPLANGESAAVIKRIQSRLGAELGEDYLLSILGDVHGQAMRISMAADGSVALEDGLSALGEGMSGLSEGLLGSADGASALSQGIGQLSLGLDATATGVEGVSVGLRALSDGTPALAQGASALSEGLGSLSGAAMGIGSGLSSMGSSLSALADKLSLDDGDAAELARIAAGMGSEGAVLLDALGSSSDAAARSGEAASDLEEASASSRTSLDAASAAVDSSAAALDSTDPSSPGALQRAQGASAELTSMHRELGEILALLETGGSPELAIERIALLEARMAALEEDQAMVVDSIDAAARGVDQAAGEVRSARSDLDMQGSVLDGLLAALDDLSAASDDIEGSATALMGYASDASEPIGRAVVNVVSVRAALAGVGEPGQEGHVPGIASGVSSMADAVSALGIQLSNEGAVGLGAAQLASGAVALDAALEPLAHATGSMADGLGALTSALSGIGQGVSGLSQGLTIMADVSAQTSAGARSIAKASQGLGDTMRAAGDELGGLSAGYRDRAPIAASPVGIESTRVGGRASAASPYAPSLLALSLWVAGMLAVALLPRSDARLVLGGRVALSVARTLPPLLLLGLVQVLPIGVAGLLFGGVPDGVAGGYWAVLLVGEACLIVANLALALAVGRAFVPVSLSVLALQLFCAGALLPAPLLPAPLVALGAILPVPIVADGLRSLFVGGGALSAVVTLCAIAALCVALAVGLTAAHRRIRPELLPAR
ncbi:MAG: hypothetical protein SOU51_00920 [Collinsella sp.]|nr:hypothetical protein [Collinsella sp.]